MGHDGAVIEPGAASDLDKAVRPRLFGIAGRMLSSATEAAMTGQPGEL